MQLPENMSGMRVPQSAQGPQTTVPGLPEEQATPEEQMAYDKLVGNALKVLFNEQSMPGILQSLNTPDPMEGVASVTAMLVQRVAVEAQKSGQRIPTDVIMHGMAEIFENVVEVSENAGVFDFSKNPKVVQGAMIRAFDEARVALQGMGMIDQREMQSDLQELQQADASGQFDAMMGSATPVGRAAQPSGPRGLMGGMS